MVGEYSEQFIQQACRLMAPLRKTKNGTLVKLIREIGLGMWLCEPVRHGGLTCVHIDDLS